LTQFNALQESQVSLVYLSSVKNGENMTQRDIAEAANVTEVTIRNRYKGLRLDQNKNLLVTREN
jgi:transcription initiation factor TFIIB